MQIAPLPTCEAERLKALLDLDVLDTESEERFDELTHLASHICGTPIALISLIDSERQWFKSAVGLDASETPRDMAFCAHAIHGTELLIVPDAAADSRFHDNPLVTGEPKIRFYAGAPLTTRQGFSLGTLCAIDRVPRELTPCQQRSLRILARQVMAQLELRQSVRQIQAAARELQAANDSKDRLFSILSHDLRAPFNGIVGFTELLATSTDRLPPAELRELAGKLNGTATQTLHLVDGLLEWCMLERGQVAATPTRVVVDDLVDEIMVLIAHTAADKDITLRAQRAPGAVVSADVNMLRSLILNVLTNAVKFTRPGGSVTVETACSDGRLVMRIRDTGVGMTAKQLESIFAPGVNTSSRGTAGESGTGLGLKLCQQFADKIGATLDATSRVDVGTTITIGLPLAE